MIDPATLQVLAAALRGVAEEMGAALVRSAHSANIKERRDCSTAVFDRDGRMIAQAEHMPVHLGAMPDAVAAVRRLRPRPGAVYVLNDPYTGGTHLPDITLVSVVDDLGLVCSRAHHADVGGMQPASMPAGATELLQEGVVIPPVRADAGGAHGARRQHAQARRAARRPAGAGGVHAGRRSAPARAGAPVRPASAGRRGWTSSTPTASGARAPPWPGCPTAGTARPTSSRATASTPAISRFRSGRDRGRSSSSPTSPARRPSSRAMSTARLRSPARPSTTWCGPCAIPISRRRAAPSPRSRCSRRRAAS